MLSFKVNIQKIGESLNVTVFSATQFFEILLYFSVFEFIWEQIRPKMLLTNEVGREGGVGSKVLCENILIVLFISLLQIAITSLNLPYLTNLCTIHPCLS